jgi:hypothetical protein
MYKCILPILPLEFCICWIDKNDHDIYLWLLMILYWAKYFQIKNNKLQRLEYMHSENNDFHSYLNKKWYECALGM